MKQLPVIGVFFALAGLWGMLARGGVDCSGICAK